jgi:hypothetical protein
MQFRVEVEMQLWLEKMSVSITAAAEFDKYLAQDNV